MLASQVRSTSVALFAIAETSDGDVGACISGTAAEDTLTVVCAVTAPVLPVAVSVYVVVAAGVTVTLVLLVTSPIPLSRVTFVAPETFQASVTCWPGAAAEGVAVNEEITAGATGGGGAVTVPLLFHVTCAVAPPDFS